MSDNTVLQVLLHEHDQIRQEAFVSMQSMQSTLQFGFAALSIVVAGASQVWADEPGLTATILLLAGPVLCVMIERVWAGEWVRLGRSTYFLWLAEARINEHIGTEALAWESWVRGKNTWRKSLKTGKSYRATLNVLLGCGAAFAIAGLARLISAPSSGAKLGVAVGWAITVFIALAYERRSSGREIQRYREDSPTP